MKDEEYTQMSTHIPVDVELGCFFLAILMFFMVYCYN